MGHHFLPVYRENATLELREMIAAVTRSRPELPRVLDFCKRYRLRAICSLFLDDDGREFATDLHKSGRAYLNFLLHSSDGDKITSKGAPWFDAIASGDKRCAQAIAEHSRSSWNKEEEFEDDFLYVLFLMKYFWLNSGVPECEQLLLRIEELSQEPNPRLGVCKAFLAGDSDEFWVAISGLLDEYEELQSKLVGAESLSPEEVATEGKLCVEALALIKLAEMKGLAVDDDYSFVPSSARDSGNIEYGEHDWKEP